MKTISEDQMFGLTYLPTLNTGLDIMVHICDVVFWKSDKSLSRKSPLLIINNSTRPSKYLKTPLFISISDNPQILEDDKEIVVSSKKLQKIFKWVVLNKELLIQHWTGKIDTISFCKNMVKLP